MGTDAGTQLSGAAVELYGKITCGETVGDGADGALGELLAWQLVTAVPGVLGAYVALDPREAARRRLEGELEALAARAARAASIPVLADDLAVHFDRSRWQSGSSEYLTEPAVVNARIGDALGRAQEELLTAQPGGPRTQELLNIAVERDSAALDRGVRVRTLYRDSVRDDAVTREWARVMTGKGAQFRTLVSPFQRCIIIDRRQAFISDYVVPDAPAHAAWHVTDRAMVAFIAQVFEGAWRRADTWQGEARVGEVVARPATRTTRQQREILRAMAAGTEQRLTAQRLGIGLRTLTKEISTLRDLWGAATLAELSYQWALSPDRLVDDQPAGAENTEGTAA